MRVVVVGAGTMGGYIAEELSREGHDVFLIDKNPSRVAQVQEHMDVLVVEGDALDARVVTEAGIENADMLLAVTDSDEQNVVIAGLAKEYGVGLVAARVRDDFYSLDAARRLLNDRLRIDVVINPDEAAVGHMLALISVPGSLEVHNLAGGKVLLATFPIHGACPMKEQLLSDMHDTPFGTDFPLAVALYRGETINVPRGSTQFQKNDEVSFVIPHDKAPAFGQWFVPDARPAQRVVILGAGSIGVNLARALENRAITVTVLDPSMDRCVSASSVLKNSTVLRGLITEHEILSEINLASTDFLVATTDDEENNLIAAFLAKEYGVKRTIVVTQHAEYVSLLKRLRIDSVVNPRLLAAGEILRFIRKGIVLSVTKIGEERPGGAEILEFIVPSTSPVSGKKLKEAGLPQGTLIGLIIDGDKAVIPHGDTEIKPGVRALVFTVRDSLKTVQKIFTPK